MMLDASITGLGTSGLVRDATPPANVLARDAVMTAAKDAGIAISAIDGLIVCRTSAATDATLGLDLHRALGLRNLKLLEIVLCEGTSAIAAIQTAALAVSAGPASHIACVFADAPLVSGAPTHASFGRVKTGVGIEALRYSAGLFGGAATFALSAQRYIAQYGASEADLAAVAISTREWASLCPEAIFREALTNEAYFASRYIAEPLRLYDCAIPVNGGVAVIVSKADIARDLAQPPVPVVAMAQGHPGTPDRAGFDRALTHGGALAAAALYEQAKIGPDDVDMCQLYDAFSIIPLLALEAYGFAPRGEAGSLFRAGVTRPGGRLPVNTGGGHLSGYYLQGMTPVAEAIVQARGQAGARQAKAETILVTNEGGRFDYHASLILGNSGRWQ